MAKSAVAKSARARLEARRKAALARLAKKKELEEEAKRNELVKQYMPYAAAIASRVAQSLSASIDFDEVLCNAQLGLLEAAKRFDKSQNVEFKTFSYYRIKGAIYDGLRKSGWLPRSVYTRLKFEEASNDYLQYMSQNAGDNPEIKQQHEVSNTVNTLASIYIISLDANEDIDIEDQNNEDVEKKAEFHEVRTYMRDAVADLPPKERQLIMMYYFQNRTLEEAGEKLKLSKSWTSRLHARALEMLLKKIRLLAAQGVTNRLAGTLPEEVVPKEEDK